MVQESVCPPPASGSAGRRRGTSLFLKGPARDHLELPSLDHFPQDLNNVASGSSSLCLSHTHHFTRMLSPSTWGRRQSHLWNALVSQQGQAQGMLLQNICQNTQKGWQGCLPRDGTGRSEQCLISSGTTSSGQLLGMGTLSQMTDCIALLNNRD